MIDPAILRPGRLDVKIKIERPDAQAAADIMAKYLASRLPLHPDDLSEHGGDPDATVAAMIQRTVERMYSESNENRFLEVTYANGDKEVLYFGTSTPARCWRTSSRGLRRTRSRTSWTTVRRVFACNTCCRRASTSSVRTRTCRTRPTPDDWARISGKKGERIVFIRTLVQGKQGDEPGRTIDNVANTGQYCNGGPSRRRSEFGAALRCGGGAARNRIGGPAHGLPESDGPCKPQNRNSPLVAK